MVISTDSHQIAFNSNHLHWFHLRTCPYVTNCVNVWACTCVHLCQIASNVCVSAHTWLSFCWKKTHRDSSNHLMWHTCFCWTATQRLPWRFKLPATAKDIWFNAKTSLKHWLVKKNCMAETSPLKQQTVINMDIWEFEKCGLWIDFSNALQHVGLLDCCCQFLHM